MEKLRDNNNVVFTISSVTKWYVEKENGSFSCCELIVKKACVVFADKLQRSDSGFIPNKP